MEMCTLTRITINPANKNVLNICWTWTQRNLFEIYLNQTETRLYLACNDWFRTKRTCPFDIPSQLVHGKYNLISVWYDKIWKRFLCVWLLHASKLRHFVGIPIVIYCRPEWHWPCKFGVKEPVKLWDLSAWESV